MAVMLVIWFWILLGVYAMLGLVFAVYFVIFGASRIDPVASGGTWGFRLLILAGATAFWPLLLGRLIKGKLEPPQERNAHRVAALGKLGGDP